MESLHTARGVLRALAPLLGLACAPTTEPLPLPAEFLLVVNAGDETLSIVPLPDAARQARISLGVPATPQAAVAANRRHAIVATGGNAIAVIDLVAQQLSGVIALPPDAVTLDAVILNDSIAFVADAGRNVLIRVNLLSRDTTSIPVGQYPDGVALTRGRLFVLHGNLGPCEDTPGQCSLGPSWITVIDPITLERSGGRDSIPLPGDGTARNLRTGGDGFLYVTSEGDPSQFDGRLAIVDPVRRTEEGNFGGLGLRPGRFASDGRERLLVTSVNDGLMEFNTRTRTVVRGAGSGIPVAENTGVAVDGQGLIYAVESGSCTGGSGTGRVRFYRPDLTERRFLSVGPCAVGAVVVLVPQSASPSSR